MIITNEGWAVLEGDTHLSKWVIENKRLDCEDFCNEHLASYLEPGMVAVDAGACLGDHTLAYARRVGPTGTVHAFEPRSDVRSCLQLNMSNYPQVKIHPEGLGDCHATAKLFHKKNIGASYISPQGTEPIEIIPLDSMAIPVLDYIKLDIEGWEFKALIGAQETIRRCKPRAICVEFNQKSWAKTGVAYTDVWDFMSKLGYKRTITDVDFPAQYDDVFEPV